MFETNEYILTFKDYFKDFEKVNTRTTEQSLG